MQDLVLDPSPKWSSIRGVEAAPGTSRNLSLRVHKNFAFELIEKGMLAFCRYARFELSVDSGDYDDSLSFLTLDGTADLQLIWLDFSRYKLAPAQLADWLSGRIAELRQMTDVPVLVADVFQEELRQQGFDQAVEKAVAPHMGVHIVSVSEIAAHMGEDFFDHERAELQGTSISGPAQLRIAQRLALNYIPATVAPRIKAIAIDLDNTLYCGVLGEDGPDGVELTAGHKALQNALVRLGEEGILLTVVSKNADEDVQDLFARRTDFPLELQHLAGRRVNWQPKAQNIEELAQDFNIDPSAFLHLDDNPAEIVQVATAIEGIDFLHAKGDASRTALELQLYPGIFAWEVNDTDRLRAGDIVAKSQRQSAISQAEKGLQGDPMEFLRSIGTRVDLALNAHDLADRLRDLPKKTNQFNLALQRLSAAEVGRYLQDPDHHVVAIALADDLSDSGNVGALFATIHGGTLIVDELCVSCRALGRGLEDILVSESVLFISNAVADHISEVTFRYRRGPRNGPALTWLAEFAQTSCDMPGDPAGDEAAPLFEIGVPMTRFGESIIEKKDAAVKLTRRVGTPLSFGEAAARRQYHVIGAQDETPSADSTQAALSPSSTKDRSAAAAAYVPPVTETERKIVKIWSGILDSAEIGTNHSFFGAGGDSIKFMNMVLEVEEVFDVRIPPAISVGNGNLSMFSAAIDTLKRDALDADKVRSDLVANRRRGSKRTILARIQRRLRNFVAMKRILWSKQSDTDGLSVELLRRLNLSVTSWPGVRASDKWPILGMSLEGTKPPIFWCFNGAHEPRAMARILGPDQPVYAIRSLSKIVTDLDYRDAKSVDLGEAYADEILTLAPDGPIFIGGNCQGGAIAEIIARKLIKNGREVSQLCLLDYLPQKSYPGNLALFLGKESVDVNPFLNSNESEFDWHSVHSQMVWDIVPGGHAQYFEEPNSQPFMARLEARLSEALARRRVEG